MHFYNNIHLSTALIEMPSTGADVVLDGRRIVSIESSPLEGKINIKAFKRKLISNSHIQLPSEFVIRKFGETQRPNIASSFLLSMTVLITLTRGRNYTGKEKVPASFYGAARRKIFNPLRGFTTMAKSATTHSRTPVSRRWQ
jgi:hypothetical protein